MPVRLANRLPLDAADVLEKNAAGIVLLSAVS